MGDFATPAAAANGGSLCLNNNLSSSLGGAGIGVNNAPHGPPPGNSATHSGGGGGTNGSSGVPKHSTVVERLRQRIEGCRRHHVNCENRYQQAQAEQLELERRDTVSLYQRTLEQRAKKSGAGGGSKQQQQHPSSKQQQDAECATAEQRNHTLIMSLTGIIASITAQNNETNELCIWLFHVPLEERRKNVHKRTDALGGSPLLCRQLSSSAGKTRGKARACACACISLRPAWVRVCKDARCLFKSSGGGALWAGFAERE
ncbi:3 [Podarcis lilfordi]|uniref:3 n=1 Tax=Podarcis lilfordi TaxID=74358 RepID=A0AA35PGZ2_9SAUR|nr:3 [Podarcis lilfordi] [Podarcis lilfordi]